MQTSISRSLAHPLGKPDETLYRPFLLDKTTYLESSQKDALFEEHYMPLAEKLRLDFEHLSRLIDLQKSLIRYEGKTLEGAPVYSLPHLSLWNKKEMERFLEEYPTLDSLESYLDSVSPSDTYYIRGSSSYRSFSLQGDRFYFDLDHNTYNIGIEPFSSGAESSADTWHLERRVFAIESFEGDFLLTQVGIFKSLDEGQTHLEPIRLSKCLLSDFLEETPKSVTYLNNNGKVSTSSIFDKLLSITGLNAIRSYEDDNGNVLVHHSYSDEMDVLIDPSFFDSTYARYSGLSVHPSLSRNFSNYEGVTMQQQDLLIQYPLLKARKNRNSLPNQILRAFDKIEQHPLVSTNINYHPEKRPFLNALFHGIFEEQDWEDYKETTLNYLLTDYNNHHRYYSPAIRLNELKKGHMMQARSLLQGDDPDLYRHFFGVSPHINIDDFFYGPVMRKSQMEQFSFNLDHGAKDSKLLTRFRSINLTHRIGIAANILAFLIYWKQNPAIEQILKDQNNIHLSAQYFFSLEPILKGNETSSLKAMGIEKEFRDILAPLEALVKRSNMMGPITHRTQSVDYFHSLNQLLGQHRENGFTFTEDFHLMFADLVPSIYGEDAAPTRIDHDMHQELNLLVSVLEASQAPKVVNPTTLHRYLQRMDLVQAIPYEQALGIWKDYVRLQGHIHQEGEEYDYFPSRSLKMYHDIALRQFHAITGEGDSVAFTLAIANMKKLGLEVENEHYLIRLPKNPRELMQEGRALNHCVGSYSSSVSNGSTIVLFLRKKETPEAPYITLEINPRTNRLKQAEGRGRRGYTQSGRHGTKLVNDLLESLTKRPPLSRHL